MFKKVLVAYDGSEPASRAFDMAVDIASKYGAALRVLAVVRPPEFGDEVETEAILKQSRQHYGAVVRKLKRRSSDLGLAIDFDVEIGHPAERIVLEAEKWGADLIVMGHRGRGLMGAWLLGSVAKQVMHHASCAVLVARKPETNH